MIDEEIGVVAGDVIGEFVFAALVASVVVAVGDNVVGGVSGAVACDLVGVLVCDIVGVVGGAVAADVIGGFLITTFVIAFVPTIGADVVESGVVGVVCDLIGDIFDRVVGMLKVNLFLELLLMLLMILLLIFSYFFHY